MTDERPTSPTSGADQPGEPDKTAPLVAGHPQGGDDRKAGAADTPHTDPDENEADAWGEESFPASDPPANY